MGYANRMARRAEVIGGRPIVYYVGLHQVAALERFRRRHGLSNASQALRAVLDVVAKSEESENGDMREMRSAGEKRAVV